MKLIKLMIPIFLGCSVALGGELAPGRTGSYVMFHSTLEGAQNLLNTSEQLSTKRIASEIVQKNNLQNSCAADAKGRPWSFKVLSQHVIAEGTKRIISGSSGGYLAYRLVFIDAGCFYKENPQPSPPSPSPGPSPAPSTTRPPVSAPPAVNAQCRNYLSSYSSQPASTTSTGCLQGTYSDMADLSTRWRWRCQGSATSVDCSALKK